MMAPVVMVTQMPIVVIMADRAAAVQSAIQVALSSPKAALEHIGSMRAERWLKTLSSPELWCIREVLVDLVDESRPGVSATTLGVHRYQRCAPQSGGSGAGRPPSPRSRHARFFAR